VVQAFGLELTVMPVSDDRVRTIVESDGGALPFQEYFVKLRTDVEVRAVRFDGIETARPAPGVIDAIMDAGVVVIAPSNPVVSIGPVIGVRGVSEALRETRASVVAVSPIVGGKTIKGPADRMMAALGMTPTAAGVAEVYADFLDVLVIDEEDRGLAAAVGAAGVRPVVAQTVMRGPAEKRSLAEAVLDAVK
jgi:LPPG:FO 2-phospho-L-lactate transferase